MQTGESVSEFLERSQAEQERRLKREQYRAAGGSARRSIKSFRTEAETAEIRAEHIETTREAIEALRTVEGARAFLVSRALNPHLSAGNAAIAALRAPDGIVGTVAHWRKLGYRVRKGEGSEGLRLTGPPSRKFFPTAAFAHTQVDYPNHLFEPMLEAAEPERVLCELIAWSMVQALRSRKPSARLVSEISKRLEAGSGEESESTQPSLAVSAPAVEDECPF